MGEGDVFWGDGGEGGGGNFEVGAEKLWESSHSPNQTTTKKKPFMRIVLFTTIVRSLVNFQIGNY